MKQALLGFANSALVTVCGLLAYDRWVARQPQVIGMVDAAEIYRLKEAEFEVLLANVRCQGARLRERATWPNTDRLRSKRPQISWPLMSAPSRGSVGAVMQYSS